MRLPMLVAVLCVLPTPLSGAARLTAQGVTTAEIRGSVRSSDGSSVEGARVLVENAGTGFTVEVEVRAGRFLVDGLEVGGPYTILVRRLGFTPQRREGAFLVLGEPLVLRFVLQPEAVSLERLRVVATVQDPAAGGTGTTIYDSLLHRLPTMNRNLYDFVALAPQGAVGVGLTGAGAGFRFNNFLIQGVPDRTLLGGQPAEFAGGRSIPLSAISEYQVLLSPFDVRYGDFAGALVNAVTRSGTNDRQGSVFAHLRNDVMARHGPGAPGLPYDRLDLGFSMGGPILRDRLHYFVAPELQRLAARAPGPYIGQPEGAVPHVPVDVADLVRLQEIMSGHGLAGGSGGAVQNRHDVESVFTRLDLGMPEWNSRGVAWVNVSRSRNQDFTRPATAAFPLSSTMVTQEFGTRTTALQLHTTLRRAGGGHNELLLSHRANWTDWLPEVQQPIIAVRVPATTGGSVTLVTGTPIQAHGPGFRSWEFTLRDQLTLSLGRDHTSMAGFQAQWFGVRGTGAFNAHGSWTFASLDDFEQGVAERFLIERDFGSASVPFSGAHYALFAADRWQVGNRLTLNAGIRAEVLAPHGRPPYNRAIDSLFGRRTDRLPDRRVHLSPRLGLVWDASDTGSDRLRGGAGIFTGRPPLAWIHAALVRYGTGIGLLRCGPGSTDLGPPPPFDPDLASPPATCGNDTGLTGPPAGEVDLLEQRLGMARTLRATLAYDRRLPFGTVVSLEALVTRHLSDFVFVNLNLPEPLGVDRHGRVLYGSTDAAGLPRPGLLADSFPAVVELRNTSRNRSHHLSVRLEKRFSAGAAFMGSYTFSRVRDVQTPLRVAVPGALNWSTGAPVGGRHDDRVAEVSLNDIPHRIVMAGTYRTPIERWPTEFSLLYVGEMGRPFTYVAWGTGGRGDLNADGSLVNDPIYVPLSAYDTTEIRFGGPAEQVTVQQAAFERFIRDMPCLDRQRGRIMERNSCRSPWSHTTIASVRQSIPLGRHRLEAQVDLFNVLNLLNRRWGLQRVPSSGCGTCSFMWTRWSGSPALLEHAAQSAPGPEGQPIFRFDQNAPRWETLRTESAFQIQAGLRYRF